MPPCENTDNGAEDQDGDGCDFYDRDWCGSYEDQDGDGCDFYDRDWCGSYDDHDFRSNEMCCICGGGTLFNGVAGAPGGAPAAAGPGSLPPGAPAPAPA